MALFKRFGSSKASQRSSGSDNDSNSANSTPNESVSGSGSEGQELTKTSSRLGRVLTGSFRSHRSRKSSTRGDWAHLHKPFTPQNLEHQKILNAFEWNFGTRRSSFQSDCSGISPCTSRRGSIDRDHFLPPTNNACMTSRYNSAVDDDVPPEVVLGNESDKDQARD